MYMEQSSTDEKRLLQKDGDAPPNRKKRHVTRDSRIYNLALAYDSELLEDVTALIGWLDNIRNVKTSED